MAQKVIAESFDSLYELLYEVNTRPKNEVMKDCDSSHKDDYDFTGTHSYEEAEKLAKYGYTELLPKIREGMKSCSKKIEKKVIKKERCLPKNMPVGYIPNVPNMLLGKPDSMINVIRTPQKVKVIEIIYVMDGNSGTNKELWIKAGAIILEAVKFIERANIRIKLSVCMYFARSGNEIAISTVKIKDFGDKLDLQKVCFPMAHPSMFRRIGFRWIETHPDIKEYGWSSGYGRSLSEDGKELTEYIKTPVHAYSISAHQIKGMDFDVIKVLNHFNCLKK